jgi:aryl-alcohol dehydrogenase-like predicted oxidoreductase
MAAGVNHLDVAPQYGRAEEVLGPRVADVRDRLFVACKTLRKNPDGVRAQLEESLSKLHCDSFDLYQLHAVTDLTELDARAGAAEAVLRAREEGLCRFVGITGHNLTAPEAHLEALRRYDLDTVMFPVNPKLWADVAYRRAAEALIEEAASRNLGVMAIKAGAARPWGQRDHTANTWYEPYVTDAELERNIRFVLSVPGVHAFCAPGDLDLLPTVLRAAETAVALTDEEMLEAMAETSAEESIFPMPALG